MVMSEHTVMHRGEEMAIRYNALYLDVRRQLREAGIEASQLEAREIVCCAAGKSREEFFRDLSLYAPDAVADRVRSFTARRLAGEPVAYLVQEWEFYGLPLYVSPEVLIPRTDTEVLAEKAIAAARAVRAVGKECRVLDLCAGSGCVGLAVAAHVPDCEVVLADYAPGAIPICQQNIRRCGLAGRVTAVQADVRWSPPPALWGFDVIACNPPYIPTNELPALDVSVREYEPRIALDGGEDGLYFYRAVCSQWKEALQREGTLLFEVGMGQADAVERILRRNGFENLQVFQDTQGILRVVSGILR